MYRFSYWAQPLSFCGSAAMATATTRRTSFSALTMVTKRRKDINDTSSASHHVELQKQTAIDTTEDQMNATKYPDAPTTDTCVSPKT